MGDSQFLNNDDILATLQELNENITTHLWLFGGVAVDFLVGRWTRPHGDIDLNTFTEYREELRRQLQQINYRTPDSGWQTHWYQEGSGRSLEIVFLEQSPDGTAVLHIHEGEVGVPGLYPLVPNYLDLNRSATLADVTFRVSSPTGEWLARANGIDVIGGRKRAPKLEHDLRLLETIIPEEELVRLRSIREMRNPAK